MRFEQDPLPELEKKPFREIPNGRFYREKESSKVRLKIDSSLGITFDIGGAFNKLTAEQHMQESYEVLPKGFAVKCIS